jgi:peptidoglycan/xylan/chitin deacetylase (PgdA/CDA1 family)
MIRSVFGAPTQILNKLQLKLQSHAIILIYHRVANLSSDPQLLSVTPDHFQAHIEHLVENYHPVSLTNLIEIVRSKKKLPRKMVCITFDDGYADNFWNAKPILEKFHVPATVFVTTGYVDSKREFWWDDLERILLLSEPISDELDLNIMDTNYHWDLKETDTAKKECCKTDKKNLTAHDPINNIKWDITQGIFPTPRHRLYIDLHRLLKPLEYPERNTILKTLYNWAGVSEIGRPDYRALNQEEIKILNLGGIVDIGSHTITHSSLKSSTNVIQKDEIFKSKQYLENILTHELTSFSYPFGSRADFSEETETMVKDAGYQLACANYSDPVSIGTNPFALPRYLVRNWKKDQFGQKMLGWYNG